MARERASIAARSAGSPAPKPGTCPDCARRAATPLVEERGRAGAAARPRARRPAPARCRSRSVMEAGDRVLTGIAELDRVLGGGVVRGLAGADRRRSGHRQVARCCCRRLGRWPRGARPGALRLGRGVVRQDEDARRAARACSARRCYLFAETDLEAVQARARDAQARACWWSTRSRPCSCRSSSRRRAAWPRCASAAARLMALAKSARHRRPSWWATSPRRAPSPGRGCSSTWWTRCSTSRASAHHAYRVLRARQEPLRLHQRDRRLRDGGAGLAEVPNPSALFLAERPAGAPGSVIVSALEGTRPLLVELQALVAPAGVRHAAAHRDRRGLQPRGLLLAVLEKRADLPIGRPGRLRQRGRRRAAWPSRRPTSACHRARRRAISTGRCAATSWCWARWGWPARCARSTAWRPASRAAAQLGFKSAIVPRSNAEGSLPMPVTPVATVGDALGVLLG